jgi:hypothetical protein
MNELNDYQMVAVPRKQMEIIDKVAILLKDNITYTIDTENDWEAVRLLFDLFRMEHPGHYEWFVEEIKKFRLATIGNKGIIKDNAGDMVQHMLEIPEIFHAYMFKMFPNQKWDRKFITKLASELPILKVANKL